MSSPSPSHAEHPLRLRRISDQRAAQSHTAALPNYLSTAPPTTHTNSGTSHSLAMFSSKLTRAAHRATTLTNAAPAPAPWTASQCFATSTTQRRPHQRRQSSSKANCPPDSSSKPAPATKAAETTAQASEAEKTPRRASRVKRTQVEKSVKGKEEANQFAGLPTVPDTRHVGEKGMSCEAASIVVPN